MEFVEKIKEEICVFRNECKEKYCVFILIVFFNNKFCVGDLWKLEKLYEYVLKLCGMSIIMVFFEICDVFEMFKDGFVLKIGNLY